MRAQPQHRPRAQRRDTGLNDHQQQEAQPQKGQQVVVAIGQHLIDHHLQELRGQQAKQFQGQRQAEDDQQTAP